MLLSRLIVLLFLLTSVCQAQVLKKTFKFSTFYVAANGNTSLADRDIYSVEDGAVLYDTVFTPFDYSLVMGIRKIKRFGYEDITFFNS